MPNIEFNYLKEFVAIYKKLIVPQKGEPHGCQETEIIKLEKDLGFDLPLSYKEFLKFLGRDYDGIFRGSDCFINDVIENTKYFPDLLAENKVDFLLPQHYLAFFSHQGYIMFWFELPKTDENPLVWFFQESELTEPPKIIGTFTDWLFKAIES